MPDPRRYLVEILEVAAVDEALFVSSPSLHSGIASWRLDPTSPANQRFEHALVKYVARMAGRSTPFGLMSGVSAGSIGRETRIELAPRAEYRRRTRLDNDYLFMLATDLARQPEMRAKLRYRPNTSIAMVAGGLRYACARLANGERSYQLNRAEPNDYLTATLARATRGARIEELAAPLVDEDVSLDDAREFVNEVVDAQLLIPELGVHVTGPEPIDGMIAQLRAAELDQPAAVLVEVRAAIAAIDARGAGQPTRGYHDVAAKLEALPTKVELARLFQVDLVKPAAITIDQRVVKDIASTIDKLARIKHVNEAQLDDFVRQFRERWEDREMPLAEVLDEEAGIGFEGTRAPGGEGAPLLAGIPFPSPDEDARVTWRAFDRHLVRRFAETIAAGAPELVLDDRDLEAMQLAAPARLPDAFAAIARLGGMPGGEVAVVLDGMTGPSGGKLLGRFCHGSRDIDAIVRAHHAIEEAHEPGAVFAEVVHLNEGRMGNILCRPVLRTYELVYLGISGAPAEHQILVEDLTVAARGDRVTLRSRRLGREVIPRLTTAHNFRLRALGVYRFLCALATQNTDMAMFSWGTLEDAPRLPRVRLGRVIVARATWNLFEHDLAPISAAVKKANGVVATVAQLRRERELPRWITIVDGDNELPIDFENPMLAAAFANEVAGEKHVVLREVFPAPDALIARGPEGGFADELILTFTRDVPARPEQPALPQPAVRRHFVPGSDWLYAKIYGGEATADRVLCEAIAPVVRAALDEGDVDRWFFIRYSDPDPHVRVRFHGDPARLTSRVLPALEHGIAPLLADGVARTLSFAAYDRELERYGGDRGIELVEEVFWRDSEAVLAILESVPPSARAEARWRLALRGIDTLLETLGFDPPARERIVTAGRDMIGTEVGADTPLWSRIGDKFAAERSALDMIFERANDATHELAPGFAILATRDAAIAIPASELQRRDVAGELSPRLADFAWSLVHMHANRMLHASQRAQELVLYDFLRRLHASRRARAKARR